MLLQGSRASKPAGASSAARPRSSPGSDRSARACRLAAYALSTMSAVGRPGEGPGTLPHMAATLPGEPMNTNRSRARRHVADGVGLPGGRQRRRAHAAPGTASGWMPRAPAARAARREPAATRELTLLGLQLPSPCLLAPTGFQRPVPRRGRARHRARRGRGRRASHAEHARRPRASRTSRAVATGPLWFQMYVQRDRGFTRELVQRAEARGCRAFVLTVDTPVLGARPRAAKTS